MTHRILAGILTKNEARHIEECIRSVSWADGVVLFDSFSQDGTVERARALGADVLQAPFTNFADQRNRALADVEARDGDWVFFLDADERSTIAMGEEMRRVVAERPEVGWWVPRYNHIVGHRMRGGGWYPDAQLRLLKVGYSHYDPQQTVHETVVLDGEAGWLSEHLVHYNYDTLAQFRQKQGRYLMFEAEMLDRTGVRLRPWTFLTMPAREFWRRYVRLRGFLDGGIGVLLCGLMAWYKFRTYLEVARRRRRSASSA